LKIFLIAGEPSGDSLGADLMAGLRDCADEEIEFLGVGGPLMTAQGMASLFPMSDLSVMGIVEVLPKIPMLLRRVRQTAEQVLAESPDVLVTVDSPDFCLRVARKVKEARPDLKTVHYVAPSVWGWRPERAEKMAKVIDHVLALLPFEPPYMERAGMTCDFVGHPAASVPVASDDQKRGLRDELGLGDAPVITLLPGSRVGEIKRMAPVIRDVLQSVHRNNPDIRFVLPAAGAVAKMVQEEVAGWPVQPIILDPTGLDPDVAETRKRTAFAISLLAVATSGTVSLELAAQGCPMVIAYQANWMTTRMVKKLALIDTANLINIVTDSREVPEFLFENCRADLISQAVETLLKDTAALAAQVAACAETMTRLGRGDPDAKHLAARSVLRAIDAGKRA
jgi:lipid-A-disaccharide synthase